MNPAGHIGIVAVSAEGAALCYRTICTEGAAVLGPHDHPQVTMHTYPLAAYMQHVDADRWYEAGQLLLSSANILVRAGADFLICPDNTLHQALDLVRMVGEKSLHGLGKNDDEDEEGRKRVSRCG